MSKLLEGKVAIVTGAGRGLGREDALALAINMFDKPEIQAFKDKLVPILKRVMQQKHAENRRLAGHYAMKLGGAKEVTCVELDADAVELAKRNANINKVTIDPVCSDAFPYIRR